MRRASQAQLELPLAAADPPSVPAARPVRACERCGWLRDLTAVCPACSAPPPLRLPPRRRGRG